jgi:hypothetical protein
MHLPCWNVQWKRRVYMWSAAVRQIFRKIHLTTTRQPSSKSYNQRFQSGFTEKCCMIIFSPLFEPHNPLFLDVDITRTTPFAKIAFEILCRSYSKLSTDFNRYWRASSYSKILSMRHDMHGSYSTAVFGKYPVQILDESLAILPEVLHGCSQSLQTNVIVSFKFRTWSSFKDNLYHSIMHNLCSWNIVVKVKKE